MHNHLCFIISFLIIATFSTSEAGNPRVHIILPGDQFKAADFEIFCYEGKPKYLIHVWQSAVLQIDHPSEDYKFYDGATAEIVQDEYQANRFGWNLNFLSWKQKQIKLDPFNRHCIGIHSREFYTVSLNIIRIDYWKVLLLAFGLFLFLSADRLSRNTLFYYLCGITVGISTSFLILIYFISKLFPRKSIMYGIAATGWTVGLYLLQLLWDNIRVILLDYKSYVAGYALITGFISFIICYRWGPIENERTRNLVRWSLQGFGLISIFLSSSFQEAALGQIIVLLLIHNIPESWKSKPQKYWKKRFPPKVKLMSNDEYYQQGARETEKALGELREFCSSPQCNQWNTALKLKDVKRFASFIEGASHLSDDEILEYETSIQATDLTDDENLTDEDDY